MFETSSEPVLSEPLAFVYGATVQNYVNSAILVLILYDHALTLRDEIETIWNRRWSFVTMVFVVNRYGTLVYGILAMASSFVSGQKSCEILTRATQAMIAILTLAFGVFSALRVYAISSRRILLATTVFALNLIPSGLYIYLFAPSRTVTTPIPVAACLSYIPYSSNLRERLVAVSHTSAMISDAVVLVATFLRTVWIQRSVCRSHMRAPITTFLIRNGSIYFITALAMHAADIILAHFLGLQLYMLSFICSVTAVLISRFFLDLRRVAAGGAQTTFMEGLSQFDANELYVESPHAVEAFVLRVRRSTTVMSEELAGM
ncbi:hypothetical protein PHLGIDRAFT_125514 [Phlebiopsis gigantea 11061_1 CR5-6]|uniref:DUF6533 domain-containing protein n=1 Tax=Phlebiopsis gigantea (strain 11061_1 CR5-6) TaxID=745531 RepID=A0A0C3SBZ5_PHLG1|nr:hypothetical protein PHLGIDRAFT_125514 [Phlebiopsis gigantea 11061_1 CR5-6]